MSTTAGLESPAHPIARFSARLHHGLDGLAASPAWVAHRTRQVRSAAHNDLRLAERLDAGFAATREALAAGRVDVAQARVVVQAVSRLPVCADGHDRERAEKHLLRLAGEFDAQALKAWADGSSRRSTRRLTKMLHALAAPRRRDPEPDRSGLTRPELMGAAFCRLLERVYRNVLGGPSVVLDQGRRRRFHDQSQRIALTVRDRGCSTEGCDRPAGWCHAHHDEVAWSDGGGTSVDRGRLLCPFHHGKAHSPAYVMTRLGHGKVRFHRRT